MSDSQTPSAPFSVEQAQAPSDVAQEVVQAAPEQSEQGEQQAEQGGEPKKLDLFAPKFAALSRKEKQVKAMEQAIKQREAELAQKMKEIEERSKSSSDAQSSWEKQLSENPLKFLREKGITMDQLVQMQLNDENPTFDMKLERLKSELENKTLKEVEELKKQLKDKEELEAKTQYERAVEAYKTEVNSYIEQNAETYELIRAESATDLVFQVAEEYYNSTGKVLDIKDAADAVEAELEEQAKKILELKKFKASQKQEPTATKTQTAPTLSNTQASEVPKNGSRFLSNEDSIREAAKLIRWQE